MATVERTVKTRQPLPEVWAFLSDFTTSEQWDPPTVRTTRTSGDGGIGTTYTNVSKFFGNETETTYVVTEFVSQQKLQLAGDASGFDLLDTMTFSSDGSTTSVTYHAEFKPRGAMKLAAPVLPLLLKVLADKVAKSLQETLDRL